MTLIDSKGSQEEEKEGAKADQFKDKPIQPKPQASARGDASTQDNKLEYIPCLYLPFDNGARKVIIYFHGNAEDIGLAYDFLYQIGHELKMHVIAVEYSGYGLYKTSGPDEQKIKEDSEIIMEYLTKSVVIRE